ncbi:MAG TPA: hypothetical protein VLB84_18145 [Bacteroidia bacterium]|nr:hypothetical protein [Bacteroidia bacterium]
MENYPAKRDYIVVIRNAVPFSILLMIMLFYFSCGKDGCIGHCYITKEEETILSVYQKGNTRIFKNNVTGEFDTLNCISNQRRPSSCSSPCNNGVGSMSSEFTFFNKGLHLKDCSISVWSPAKPTISFGGFDLLFTLSGNLQSAKIGNEMYDDVYIMLIDSTAIPLAERDHIPWEIIYSKSIGFIRFQMTNGQSWNKF